MNTTPDVLKFGGSSFPTPQAYGRLARALVQRVENEGRPLAVIVSAMPGETEALRDRLHEIDPHPADSNAAALLTLADTVSAQLLAAAVHREGRRATVLAGHQLGVTTNSSFMWARIEEIDPTPLQRAVAGHDVVIVPGGQAVDAERRPTWLGKNSSDLSAIIVAAALGASRCEIHSDVDGIYSADPNLVTGTRLMRQVSYETAAALSTYGAKVLHRRAVQLARQHGISIVCRLNTEPFRAGTVIGATGDPAAAVIVNRRSVVLNHRDDTEADLAYSTFRTQGVDAVRLSEGPRVALIGGFLDLAEFQRRHDLPPAEITGIPVTALRGSQAEVHTAADEHEAVGLAQRLHDELYAEEPRLTAV
ncbi:amino acid kinase family protein [Streptantibioticus cattleyicolor]|uniref:aspartate kinase n=1 Tax=Streptantibioticus cattleyicolor (strain ATCC 35852 / DSM 46488 / JCM 4925 / NBRC 14057 / NRRL 8057) TaxID=1003195 RepID=F8JK97_STREN|nr:aspartate kinase [Streptantibioticus cattleyicolor]AEW98542.1 Aspartate kinase [Streptantibioticus cattleyicolor NRRL 8057 = DSM 46488]CCB72400.1 Aspartokinase [Streptantibioticus cattleyicolor NRRL 8057 = DSM 46488]